MSEVMETDRHDVIRAIEQAVEEKREGHSVVAWVRSETRARGLVGVSGEMIRADRFNITSDAGQDVALRASSAGARRARRRAWPSRASGADMPGRP